LQWRNIPDEGPDRGSAMPIPDLVQTGPVDPFEIKGLLTGKNDRRGKCETDYSVGNYM
jgi:hypothetical protein